MLPPAVSPNAKPALLQISTIEQDVRGLQQAGLQKGGTWWHLECACTVSARPWSIWPPTRRLLHAVNCRAAFKDKHCMQVQSDMLDHIEAHSESSSVATAGASAVGLRCCCNLHTQCTCPDATAQLTQASRSQRHTGCVPLHTVKSG